MEKYTKANIRLSKVRTRFNKPILSGLTKDEKDYIKAFKERGNTLKHLTYLYGKYPRLPNAAVDWDSLSESDLNEFECAQRKNERLQKKLSKLEDKLDVKAIWNKYNDINNHSESY